MTLDNNPAQTGPRAHHFVAILSALIGISFLTEDYTTGAAQVLSFALLSQHVWGYCFLALGVFTLFSFNIYLRALFVVLGSGLWGVYTICTLWASVFSPRAGDIGSAIGILALGMTATCFLAVTNIRRDFTTRAKRENGIQRLRTAIWRPKA